MLIASFFSHPVVFATSEAEVIATALGLLTVVSLFGSMITWYRHSRCHEHACRREWQGRRLPLRRHGKYPHGHLKLCHIHHPDTPNNGKITVEHIQQVTDSQRHHPAA